MDEDQIISKKYIFSHSNDQIIISHCGTWIKLVNSIYMVDTAINSSSSRSSSSSIQQLLGHPFTQNPLIASHCIWSKRKIFTMT